MLRFLRMIFFMHPPQISKEQALELARKECERRGWEFKDPQIEEQLRGWWVWIDCRSTTSPFVLIDNQSGKTLLAGGPRPAVRQGP